MLFSVKKEKSHITTLLPALLLAVALCILIAASASLASTNQERETEILSNALDRSITQCYALEGSYPPDLDYLKEHYGLTYNSDRYFIDYRYIGSNLRPNTIIIERD